MQKFLKPEIIPADENEKGERDRREGGGRNVLEMRGKCAWQIAGARMRPCSLPVNVNYNRDVGEKRGRRDG
jgi:hypothetical protein